MNPHMRTIKCKHFTGSYSNDRCGAGIEYASVRQSGGMLPCVWGARQTEPCGGCEAREFPTDEEIAEERRKTVEMFEKVVTAREAITKDAAGQRGVTGKIDCPVCGNGVLGYSVAKSNGHVWAKCSTEGCVAWME